MTAERITTSESISESPISEICTRILNESFLEPKLITPEEQAVINRQGENEPQGDLWSDVNPSSIQGVVKAFNKHERLQQERIFKNQPFEQMKPTQQEVALLSAISGLSEAYFLTSDPEAGQLIYQASQKLMEKHVRLVESLTQEQAQAVAKKYAIPWPVRVGSLTMLVTMAACGVAPTLTPEVNINPTQPNGSLVENNPTAAPTADPTTEPSISAETTAQTPESFGIPNEALANPTATPASNPESVWTFPNSTEMTVNQESNIIPDFALQYSQNLKADLINLGIPTEQIKYFDNNKIENEFRWVLAAYTPDGSVVQGFFIDSNTPTLYPIMYDETGHVAKTVAGREVAYRTIKGQGQTEIVWAGQIPVWVDGTDAQYYERVWNPQTQAFEVPSGQYPGLKEIGVVDIQNNGIGLVGLDSQGNIVAEQVNGVWGKKETVNPDWPYPHDPVINALRKEEHELNPVVVDVAKQAIELVNKGLDFSPYTIQEWRTIEGTDNVVVIIGNEIHPDLYHAAVVAYDPETNTAMLNFTPSNFVDEMKAANALEPTAATRFAVYDSNSGLDESDGRLRKLFKSLRATRQAAQNGIVYPNAKSFEQYIDSAVESSDAMLGNERLILISIQYEDLNDNIPTNLTDTGTMHIDQYIQSSAENTGLVYITRGLSRSEYLINLGYRGDIGKRIKSALAKLDQPVFDPTTIPITEAITYSVVQSRIGHQAIEAWLQLAANGVAIPRPEINLSSSDDNSQGTYTYPVIKYNGLPPVFDRRDEPTIKSAINTYAAFINNPNMFYPVEAGTISSQQILDHISGGYIKTVLLATP